MRQAWSLDQTARPMRRYKNKRLRYEGPHIGPKVRLPQAKDVPEESILRVLRERPHQWHTHWQCHACGGAECWSLRCRAPELAGFPEKVLRAKLSSMMRRKIIDGCDCGCRGDWHIPELFYAPRRSL